MQVKQCRNYQGTIVLDSNYYCIMNIDYNPTDSVVWGHIASMTGPDTMLKAPAISLYDTLTGMLYKKLGLDSIGRIYNQKDGYYNLFEGGFIGTDSINCYFGNYGPHNTDTDTLRGHRL